MTGSSCHDWTGFTLRTMPALRAMPALGALQAFGAVLALGAMVPLGADACPLARIGGWGSFGSAQGQFNFAHHLAVDPASGDVYVGDLLNHRVQHFGADGAFLGQWARPGVDAVAVGPDGSIYVTGNDSVTRHTATGNLLDTWGSTGSDPGQFRFPIDVAVDAQGLVYVADLQNHRLQKFTATGSFLEQWPTSDSGPISVAISPTGEVYTTDVTRNEVQVFTSNGAPVRSWGVFGTGDGEFDSPGKVGFDAAGNVLVPDGGNGRVQVYTPTGGFLCGWGSQGSGTEQLFHLTAVGARLERVYVMDKDNHRVVVLENPPLALTPYSWSSVKNLYRAP